MYPNSALWEKWEFCLTYAYSEFFLFLVLSYQAYFGLSYIWLSFYSHSLQVFSNEAFDQRLSANLKNPFFAKFCSKFVNF